MRTKMKLLLVCVAVLFGVAPVILADWNPGDPAKWVQLPDPTPMGIDIRVDNRGGQRAIGDDFLCTSRAPITDVHLWVSWKGDISGAISGITLRIYSNNPTGPSGFSQPDQLLWQRQFASGEFTTRLYYTMPAGLYEGWWDPRSGGYIPTGDAKIWQININIDSAEAFVQQGSPEIPIIYWLVVEAQLPTGTTMFGWKTRDLADGHFMDDAVWRSTPTSSWIKMTYPSGHPYYMDSIDMAFVITGKEQPSEYDFGDAPEGSNAIAYPATGVTGAFPTCMTIGAAGWIQHTNFGAWFGPSVDFERDGNAGLCPTGCFPPYDQDECFADGDAGLIVPQPYTIDATLNVVPCPQCSSGTPLGNTCQTAVWGVNMDIDVQTGCPDMSRMQPDMLIFLSTGTRMVSGVARQVVLQQLLQSTCWLTSCAQSI